VIPSKIFEAMAMERPLILGVEGESKAIIEEADCGICIEPENAEELVGALRKLHDEDGLGMRLGKNGRKCVEGRYNRDSLAAEYLTLLGTVTPEPEPQNRDVVENHRTPTEPGQT